MLLWSLASTASTHIICSWLIGSLREHNETVGPESIAQFKGTYPDYTLERALKVSIGKKPAQSKLHLPHCQHSECNVQALLLSYKCLS